jgi:hypothetical protein
MSFNKIYKKFNNNKITFKKIININVNNKNYIRYIRINNEKICSIDTGSFLLIGKTEKKTSLGVSILNNKFRLKHSLNDLLKIDSLLEFITPNLNLISKKIIKIIFLLLKKKKNYMLLLNPIPGGFKAYYIGIFGFIPYSQVKKVYSDLLKKELVENNKFFSSIIYNKKENNIILNKSYVNKKSLSYLFLRLLHLKELYKYLFLKKISLTINQISLKTSKNTVNYTMPFFKNKKIKRGFNLVFILKNL